MRSAQFKLFKPKVRYYFLFQHITAHLIQNLLINSDLMMGATLGELSADFYCAFLFLWKKKGLIEKNRSEDRRMCSLASTSVSNYWFNTNW